MKRRTLVILATFSLLAGCSSQQTSQVPINQNVNVQPPIAVNPPKPKKEFQFHTKVSADKLDERFTNYVKDITTKNLLKGNSFMLSFFPWSEGSLFLGLLNTSYSKRYSDEQIKDDFIAVKQTVKSMLGFSVFINFIGGYSDTSDMTLDDKTYEYFFIENDKGEYVRSIGQDPIEIGKSIINMLSSGQVVIYFNPDEVSKIAKDSTALYLTFDGLKIVPQGKNRIKLQYPINLYYQKEFPEIDSMLEDIKNAT